MEKQSLTLQEAEVYFSKIVANATPTYWSQTYNAGSLFAVLSLHYKEITDDAVPLSLVGKEVFNTLEEEYFTLESKDFNSIKDAVAKSLEKVPGGVVASFLVATIPPGKEHILYVYMQGGGSAMLRRGSRVGSLLEPNDTLTSASGILEDKDTLILLTDQFRKTVPLEKFNEALDLAPADIAQVYGPKLQEQGDGGEAAIVLAYHKKSAAGEEVLPTIEPLGETQEAHIPSITPNPYVQEQEETNEYEYTPKRQANMLQTILQRLPRIPLSFPTTIPTPAMPQLGHRRKIYLTIAALLVVAVAVSVYSAVKSQQDAKDQAEAQRILDNADKKYNEGQVLLGLNKNLARDDLEEAKKILTEGQAKFKKGSKQYQEIQNEIAKVDTALAQVADQSKVEAKEVAQSNSPLLTTILKNGASFATQDDTNVYGLTSDAIFSTDKSGSNKKQLVKNDSAWKQAAGIGTFGGNLYVLDKSGSQILKFVATAKDYVKSSYLAAGTTVDFSKAVHMTIDSSIYILSSDRSIQKFTRGKADTFTVAGLTKPFSKPTRIYTSSDLTSIYVLDPGNGSIVSLSKTGAYQSTYQASILKNAQDFEVSEKSKKIYILASGKLYELSLP